ncbi:hypothetical protein BDR05DRAFT_641348 [Suillus weaverae]|nr:hypothetical protein BDR05DRAFT_641348 [Suillus weaverae]
MSAGVRALFPRLLGGWPYTRLPPAKRPLSQPCLYSSTVVLTRLNQTVLNTHRSTQQRSVIFFIFYHLLSASWTSCAVHCCSLRRLPSSSPCRK